jgi:hypothetical protein
MFVMKFDVGVALTQGFSLVEILSQVCLLEIVSIMEL